MWRTKKIIYAAGFYQIGKQAYGGALSYYNSFVDETPLKEKLSVFKPKGAADGTEWAIVTGASEGIGSKYALELAKAGYNIKLVARSVDKMEKVAAEARSSNPAIKTEVVQMDVGKAHPSDYAALFKEGERTSIVVNNAGVMWN